MSPEARFRCQIVLATGIVAMLLAIMSGLVVRGQEIPPQAFVLGCLGLCGMFFHLRQNQRFVEIVAALLQVLAFTIFYTVAMYAVCSMGRPLVDDRLAACDAALGIHLPAIVAWTQRHPVVGAALDLAYGSVLPQTLLVVLVLGLADRRRELHGFLMAFFLGLLLVLAVFAAWPAAGPFAAYGFEPSAVQSRYLDQFQGFRSGTYRVVSWQAAEGLVTFPSFHTAWALLLAYALRWNRWLFVPGAFLNVAVILSTMTTGWHYFADVLGGIALAVGSVMLCQTRGAWREWNRNTDGLTCYVWNRRRFADVAEARIAGAARHAACLCEMALFLVRCVSSGFSSMHLFTYLPRRFFFTIAVMAVMLLVAYDLSEYARCFSDRTFLWPIDRMLRSIW